MSGWPLHFLLLFLLQTVEFPVNTPVGTDTATDAASIAQDTVSVLTILPAAENQVRATGLCGTVLSEPIRVLVLDGKGSPVEGIPVVFRITSRPDQSEGDRLAEEHILTDSTGLAGTLLTLGSRPGIYQVTGRIREGFPDNEVLFQARASSRNWIFMLIIGLLGGLGLFLFGMHTMSEGLKQSAGERMRGILEQVTRNRIVGAGIGTLVTTIIQSSSATSVMLVSFVNARLLQFRQTIPVLLGAALGTTITAQIIAFRITEYSLLLVAAGFFIQSFSRKEHFRAVGYSLFGFGILFFGMKIMSDAMAPLREWTPFIELLLKLENPALGILAGALFTALIQSSSAFIGIMIVLASQGLLSLDASIPLLLGSNLGTTVTALLSGLKSSLEAKKVAVAFLVIKIFSVVIFAGWTSRLGNLVVQFTPEASLQRLIANSHTIINTILLLAVLPITPLVVKLVDYLVGKPSFGKKPALQTQYLDESMISTPSIALNLAKQEIIRMGMIVSDMFGGILKPFVDKDLSQLDRVYAQEEKVNYLRDAIKEYLLRINRETTKTSRINESFLMLYTLNEFEKIADIISGNLAIRAEKWSAREFRFSESGTKELAVYHGKIGRQIRRVLEVFDETNLQKAALIKQKHKEYRVLSRELEKQHYARITEGIQESVESSTTHLEILALLATIDSHATNIARIALEWNQKAT